MTGATRPDVPLAGESPRYFAFWWPLALTGLAMVLARQFQNGALARYPDAARELAVFALATGTFQLHNASVGFVPHMTNVLARSRRDARVVLLFLVAAATVVTLPLLLLAFTVPGGRLLATVYGIDGAKLSAVTAYLKVLAPLILVNAMRHYNVGRLVQASRTGVVTVLNVLYLASIVLLLIAGLSAEWSAVRTLATAQVSSAALHLVLSTVLRARLAPLEEEGSGEPLRPGDVFAYFWPVAVTSTMFALSRPVIYAFAGRTSEPDRLIAALRVAFDFSVVFHNPLNQVRHLFTTFGEKDLAGLRRFLMRIFLVTTGGMAVVAFTPPGAWVFREVMGIETGLVPHVRAAMAGLCLIPLVVTVRNYFHGLALIRRRTRSMAMGGVLRLAAIAATSAILHAAGCLTPLGGGAALLTGFTVEMAVVMTMGRRAGR